MEETFEWELIEAPKHGDLELHLPRKICRTSILSRLSGAYDRCEIGTPPLQDRILKAIPKEGITADAISRLLDIEIGTVYCSVNIMKRNGKVVSVKVNGRNTRYFKVDSNDLEILTLPYRPKYP